MEHEKTIRQRARPCLFLPTFLLLLIMMTACGGTVPPPPKKAGTAPQDKPLVESTIPFAGENNVILNKSVSVTFSKAMSSETLSSTTFSLNDGTAVVLGKVTLTGTTAVFKPTSNLKGSTLFTATVTQGVQDTFGNSLAKEMMWSFTTAALDDPGSTDIDPPLVLATNPIMGEKNVSTNTTITVTFNEAIDPATVIVNTPDETFFLNHGTDAAQILISPDNKTFTFVPDKNLKDKETIYQVTITTGVRDLSGNPLSANFNWSFTTVAEPTGGE